MLEKPTPSGLLYITRVEQFSAAHKLYNPEWTDEQNLAVFGPCANANWHGHNFTLEITVAGKPGKDTGFVMDLKALSRLVKDLIISKVDHKNLNEDVDFMQGKLTSCENILIAMWDILYPAIRQLAPEAFLYKLKLVETPRNYVEYYG